MSKLQKYNLCMDAISSEIGNLATNYKDGAVVGVFNESESRVELHVFSTLQEAKDYRGQVPEPGASPLIPIKSDFALML